MSSKQDRLNSAQLQAALEDLYNGGEDESSLGERPTQGSVNRSVAFSDGEEEDMAKRFRAPKNTVMLSVEELKSLAPVDGDCGTDVIAFGSKLQSRLNKQSEALEKATHRPHGQSEKVDMSFASELQRKLCLNQDSETSDSHAADGKRFHACLQSKLADISGAGPIGDKERFAAQLIDKLACEADDANSSSAGRPKSHNFVDCKNDHEDVDDAVVQPGMKAPHATAVISVERLMQLEEGEEEDDTEELGRGTKAPCTTAILATAQLMQLEESDDDQAVVANGLRAPTCTATLSSAQLAALSDEDEEEARPVRGRIAPCATKVLDSALIGSSSDEDAEGNAILMAGVKAPRTTTVVSQFRLAASVDDQEGGGIDCKGLNAMAVPQASSLPVAAADLANALTAKLQQGIGASSVIAESEVQAAADVAPTISLASLSKVELRRENERLADEIESLRLEVARRRHQASTAAHAGITVP
eukprot:TRINITY_DN27057_c0_g1_i1.p1 TRINITY_DN27057_c0_g1~~TRINITY_DN27057_c0_g1_i1.p1  ORF type:complete len:474 (+),score=87.69 TRINITY_DN27057_c0_g1_i1:259-1680(+)